MIGPPPQPATAYSNHGLGLCGHIIHVVSGIEYIDFMQAFIFSPLQLNIINSPVNFADLINIDSKRYNYYTSGLPYKTSLFDGTRVYGAYGYKRGDLGAASGGWVATARDLIRIMCATDQLPNQSDILSPESLDEMESVPFPELSTAQAHGWSKADNGKLAKNGKTSWGAAYMAKYPSGINVAIIINTGASSDLLRSKCNIIEGLVATAGIPVTFDLFGDSLAFP